MRKFEVIESDNKHHRLTITPDRITVKVLPNTESQQVEILIMEINVVAFKRNLTKRKLK